MRSADWKSAIQQTQKSALRVSIQTAALRYFGVAIMSDERLDVAQVSKPAVSLASKPAKRGAVVRSADWKSAIQQTQKSALHVSLQTAALRYFGVAIMSDDRLGCH